MTLILSLAITTASPAPAAANAWVEQQDPAASVSPDIRDAVAGLHVYLLTVGQGDAIWEKFGHNAIWLLDEDGQYDVAFNYGIFDSFQEGFVARLVRGEMLYSMAAFDGTAMVQAYSRANRTIVAQELNLTAAQKTELRSFLEWNARPENRDYLYDYYRDNCSTRVRDALDRVLGGAIRDRLEPVETGTTYRWHTSRLTLHEIPAYTGLLLGLGQPVDRPINAWEESFLPGKLMEHVRTVAVPTEDPGAPGMPLVMSERTLFEADRAPEADRPPNRTAAFTAVGAATGFALILLGMGARRRRTAAVGFYGVALIWTLAAGTFGTLILLLWTSTGHVTSYNNENVLQVGPLSLLLAPALILAAAGRAQRFTRILAATVAGLALLGFTLQLLPAFFQVNGPIIGLVLPIHVGLAAGLFRATRTDTPDDSGSQRHTSRA